MALISQSCPLILLYRKNAYSYWGCVYMAARLRFLPVQVHLSEMDHGNQLYGTVLQGGNLSTYTYKGVRVCVVTRISSHFSLAYLPLPKSPRTTAYLPYMFNVHCMHIWWVVRFGSTGTWVRGLPKPHSHNDCLGSTGLANASPLKFVLSVSSYLKHCP